MDTKDLIELAGNPNFISGIYNYCDRWCERCPFTSRCLVYATEKEDEDDDPESRDMRNAAFWLKLKSIFEQTREMMTAWAEENGVDLSNVDARAAIEEHDRELADARTSELTVAAESYAWQVKKWFDEEFGVQTSDDSGASAADTGDEDDSIDDAIEVIRWYQFQIAAKTVRALMSRHDEDDEEGTEASLSRHSDGSIKVALIAMDRSISAWRILQIGLPDKADSIVQFLLALEALRQSTERAFPNARDFIRPGFDEGSVDMVH